MSHLILSDIYREITIGTQWVARVSAAKGTGLIQINIVLQLAALSWTRATRRRWRTHHVSQLVQAQGEGGVPGLGLHVVPPHHPPLVLPHGPSVHRLRLEETIAHRLCVCVCVCAVCVCM